MYIKQSGTVLTFLYSQVSKQIVCVQVVSIVVFNAIFNNISFISWRSVLLVEETEYPGKTTDISPKSITRPCSRLWCKIDYGVKTIKMQLSNVLCMMRSGITFIRYGQSQEIGNINHLIVIENNIEISSIGKGPLCPTEIDLCFNK